MKKGNKEWLEERFNQNGSNGDTSNYGGTNRSNDTDDDDDHDSLFSIDSNDTLHNFIEFQSHRNSIGLEEAISFTFPFEKCLLPSPMNDDKTKKDDNHENSKRSNNEEGDDNNNEMMMGKGRICLSTLLEEDDLVPIFDGAGWAGTRVWSAAIWGIKYLIEEFGESSTNTHSKLSSIMNEPDASRNVMTLCELGCGLGVPGMIWHQMGRDTVLTDQERIMSQLTQNVKSNFEETYVCNHTLSTDKEEECTTEIERKATTSTIQAEPLDWSREGYQNLLKTTGYPNGFDIVLNCDCVYEPLYGKSWELLVEVIDECLKINSNCIIVTSVERRSADGIDDFVNAMKSCEFVGSVEKVLEDKNRKLELYITKGIQ